MNDTVEKKEMTTQEKFPANLPNFPQKTFLVKDKYCVSVPKLKALSRFIFIMKAWNITLMHMYDVIATHQSAPY